MWETLEILRETLIIGTVIGGIWALVASGFSLTFGVARIFNFAHGTYFAIAAYVATVLYPAIGFPSIFLAVIIAGLFGLVVNTLIKPIRDREIMVILLTLSVALSIEQLLLIVFQDTSISIPPIAEGVVEVAGVPVTYTRIVALAIALLCIAALELFIGKTKLGREINATSQNAEAAMIVGIDVERVFSFTMLISAILAGVGGVLYAQIYSVNPETAFRILIYAFAVVILGGLGSIKGSIIAAFLIGYVQTFVSIAFSSRWSEVAVIAVIIAGKK